MRGVVARERKIYFYVASREERGLFERSFRGRVIERKEQNRCLKDSWK